MGEQIDINKTIDRIEKEKGIKLSKDQRNIIEGLGTLLNNIWSTDSNNNKKETKDIYKEETINAQHKS